MKQAQRKTYRKEVHDYSPVFNHLFPVIPKAVVAVAFIVLFFAEREPSPGTAAVSARRIVSLSPAISRQICDLGEEERIVGVTSWDDLASKKGMTVVGNLIQINMEMLVTLRPDMIFSSQEDGTVQRIEKIHHLGLHYHTFSRNRDYKNIEDNYLALARMLGREDRARRKLRGYRHELTAAVKPASPPVIAFFISHDPLIPVTRVSHINTIIEDAGGRNAFSHLEIPYPVVSGEALVRINPDIIISMAHGSENILPDLLKKIASVRAVREGRVFTVSYDSFCSFTPADYVSSVKVLSKIINRAPVHAD